jgi:hypothetical protein
MANERIDLGNMRLPTIEEAEASIRKGEEMIIDLANQRKGKIMRSDPEMDRIVIGPLPKKIV